jgi:hypothetical protein
MKKTFLAITVYVLLISFTALPVYADAFPDVSGNSEYYAAIEYYFEKGVIEGYEDGTFRPNQEANRAEALKIILLGSEIEGNEVEGFDIFPDVTLDDWFYPYVQKGYELEIVEGYEDETFKPHQILNVAETLKMVLRTRNNDGSDEYLEKPIYPDVTADLWYAPFALLAKDKNIIEPQDDGTLNAGRTITRGELIEIMYRTEMVWKNDSQPFDISTNWLVHKFPEYAFEAKLPFTWRLITNEDEIVFWRQDEINHQSSYEIPFPYSAEVVFHLDKNEDGLSAAAYEEQLEVVYKSDFGSYQKNSLTLAGYPTVEFNVSPVHDDFFVFYPENYVLHIYTSYGWSDLTPQLQLEIEKILDSVAYIEPNDNPPSENLLSDVRNRILVEGIGQETLDLFNDLVNIETDTIGVGTGPVDYFYSETYDVTIKYERSTDTILDMQNGQTTAF